MASKNDWTDPSSDVEAEIKHLVENTDLSPLQAGSWWRSMALIAGSFLK
ncbi:hypothetical protein [Aerobium aerolatum]|uniref:Uncharacterized protein n=1 Tax=Aquamicrobium aerolatum DSM 21857 TaxID=1121003 RepID=A0A1I3T6B6_9HYPH|nr:hypothetical protein [Aquamicrobium aerolatum]SFJ66042.1 hypothetical protein SAMN03080618_03576 [Aquamicrobium aerolatum DSM 21857]